MAKHSRGIVWSRDAEDDLLRTWLYGAEEWTPDAADAHQRLIFRSCARLLENPALGRSREEIIRGLRSMVVEPHVVYYRIYAETIEIVRVLHEREDVESIFT